MKNTIDEQVQLRGLGGALLENIHTGVKRWIPFKNIVTDDGDRFYSQRGALLTAGPPVDPLPDNFVDANGEPDMIMELYSDAGTPNAAPAKGNDRSNLTGTIAPSSGQPMDATYPLTDDPDGDNSGSGSDIITYRRSYTTAQANLANISDLILTNPSPGASEPLIMHAEFASTFTKTSDDTLKVFVNHQINGV